MFCFANECEVFWKNGKEVQSRVIVTNNEWILFLNCMPVLILTVFLFGSVTDLTKDLLDP